MQNTELNSLYLRLQEEIDSSNSEKIQNLCDKILHLNSKDNDIQYIKALSQIKGDNPSQAAAFYNNKPSSKDKPLFFSYIYYLYKTGEYNQALHVIEKEADKKDKAIQLLKAQILYSSKKYQDSTDIYINILENNKKDTDFEDILANCLCVESHREFLGKDGNKETIVLEKLIQEHDNTREALFNYGVFLSLVGQKQKAEEILTKFEGIVKKSEKLTETDKEDLIMAHIQKDFNDSQSKNYNHEIIEQKLKYYEQLNQNNIRETNLKAVINNNIVSLRGLYKNQHYGESVKLIEESINQKWKQTEEQLLTFKINKLLLVLNKNKLVECTNIIKDIEKNYSQQNLLKSHRYITVKSFMLLKMERFDELNEFMNQQQEYCNKNNDNNFRLIVFLINSEIYRQKNEKHKIIDLFMQLHEADKSVYENEIICSFIFSILLSDSKLLEKSRPILDEIAQKSNSLQVLEVLGDIYYRDQQIEIARGIFEKILQQDPSSRKYRLKLAGFYATEDPQRAELLLSQFEDDIELLNPDEIEKLESELALSKISATQQQQQQQNKGQNSQQSNKNATQQQEDKKKKKRKVRLPKNFDPLNPGPKPDPERWLPKYERKEFRKKRGAGGQGRNTTQGSSSAQNNKETKGTFTNAQSSATQDVASSQQVKQGGKGKGKGGRRK